MIKRSDYPILALCAVAATPALTGSAKIDPEPRQLVHLDHNQLLAGERPRAASISEGRNLRKMRPSSD